MPTGIYKRNKRGNYSKKSWQDRFWNKVNKTKTCWEWMGGKAKDGYGVFWRDKKLYSAHRVSYGLYCGKIPKGLCVLHTCDNPPCVRPDHLFLGTHRDNKMDCINKNRQTKGENQHLAKLKKDKVLEIRRLYRKENISQRKLAKEFNVTQGNINAIVTKRTWKHI